LPVPQEPLAKKFLRILFEENLENALKEVNDSNIGLLSSISKGMLKIINYGNQLKMFFNPHLKQIGIENYENLSQVRSWNKSPIKFISFNPHCFKIAVGSVDDSIRIYTNEEHTIVPLLKSGMQKTLMSMAWRPYSSILAVGCGSGFLIWTIDSNSNISRPLSQVVSYKHENHFPVNSLDFSPNGNLLATCSINDSSILIWDIDKNVCTPLRRTSVPFLDIKWSVNGQFLFTSTVGNVFRVWDCEKWNSDKWTIANGHVKSFQWSPCTKFLLFITSADPMLFCLGFADEPLYNKSSQFHETQRALPVADLSKVTLENSEAGGIAQQLAWNGKYLAISFKETNSVAIFQTSIRQHNLHVLPMFFISGIGIEFPTFITFQPAYSKPRSVENVLTIAWSTGRVQFFPFV
jgi:aladin